jgi:5-methylcytosine-specific restriction endonuclease McrA
MIACQVCHIEFVPKANQNYCSRDCRYTAYKLRRKNGNIGEKSQAWYAAVLASREQIIKTEYKRYISDNIRKRADKIEFELSEEEFAELIFDVCFYCGAQPSIPTHSGKEVFRNSIDRVDNNLGYSYDNCVTSCWTCNRMKNKMDVDEFLQHIGNIYLFNAKKEKVSEKLTLRDRASLYQSTFPDYPAVWYSKKWLLGNWSIGNNYAGSGWHGSYPPSYLKRIHAMFPEFTKNDTLHLFSGSLSPGFGGDRDWAADFPGVCFDGNKDLGPDVCGDAEKLSTYFQNQFGIILADCPYSDEDANKYGFTLINRNKVVKECHKVLKPGGFLCWMDMVLPMYSKKEFERVGEIAISRSTNHRVRAVFIFRKV